MATGTMNTLGEEIVMEVKPKLSSILKRGWDTFHRYFVYILIAILFGIYIGVSVSKVFYSNKIQENIQIGGMVYKEKIYTITLK